MAGEKWYDDEGWLERDSVMKRDGWREMMKK